MTGITSIGQDLSGTKIVVKLPHRAKAVVK
jgi:hypothetical protein